VLHGDASICGGSLAGAGEPLLVMHQGTPLGGACRRDGMSPLFPTPVKY
jgi:hypothetical protein